MHDNEAAQMMQRCSAEIKSLRATIARLQPKAEAYDNMAALIGLLPRPSVGYGEDLAWLLDKKITELTAAPAPTEAEVATE